MLPEFPRLMNEFDRAITNVLRQRARAYEGPVAEIQKHAIFEGHRTAFVGPEGLVSAEEFFEASSEVIIPFDEATKMELPDVINRLDASVRDVALQKSKKFYETINESVSEVGNVIDGKGRPFTAEIYLEVLEKLWIEFNEDGSPRLPTMIASPALRARAGAEFARLEMEEDLRREFGRIINQKREQWRAREALRELVG